MAFEWSNVDYIGFAYAIIVAVGGTIGKIMIINCCGERTINFNGKFQAMLKRSQWLA